MTHAKPPCILIADSDLEFVTPLRSEPAALQTPPIFATSEQEAVKRLSDTEARYSAILLSPQLVDPNSIPLVRIAMKYFPAAPLFFLAKNGDVSMSSAELQCLTIRKIIDKNLGYAGIMKEVEKGSTSFDPEEAIQVAKRNRDEISKEVLAEDASFSPVVAEQFLSGSTSLFDLYVKIVNGKFLKILQAGDAFDGERVNEYLKRGVTHFYLKKEAQESYMNFCNQISAVSLQKTGLPARLKSKMVLNYGEQTLIHLVGNGVSANSLSYAKAFSSRVRELIDNLGRRGPSPIDSLASDLKLFDHGVSMTFLGALVSRELKFNSDKSVETVGLSCLLHDIGLLGQPEAVRTETEALMTPDQLSLFREHPALGAKILEAVPGMNAAVVQAVLQHHERRDRMGFPSNLGTGSINCIAEIVGICDEYLRLLSQTNQPESQYVKQMMEGRVYHLFSDLVANAFRRAIFAEKGDSHER